MMCSNCRYNGIRVGTSRPMGYRESKGEYWMWCPACGTKECSGLGENVGIVVCPYASMDRRKDGEVRI